MHLLPIDIINKILQYKSELNNDMLVLQYDDKNKEKYIINWYSNCLINISALLIIKRYYPLTNPANITNTNNRYLYKGAKDHYKHLLLTNIYNI